MRKIFHSIIIPFIGFLILFSGCGHNGEVAPVSGSNSTLMKWAVIDSSGDHELTFSIGPRYFTPDPSTTIEFGIPSNAVVTLTVYDERSIETVKLLDHQQMIAGENQVTFNASNYSSGVYIYKLIAMVPSSSGEDTAVTYKAIRKMMLIK